MYQYLYLNIKQFFRYDEEQFKLTKKNTEFNFISYKLDPIFNECKFELSCNEFKKISKCHTPFEKLKIIFQVNNLIEKEAKETFDKHNNSGKVFFTPSGDNLWVIWVYIVINTEIKNLLTEVNILRNFKIKESFLDGEAEFHMTNMIAAVDHLFNLEKEKKQPTLQPYYISSNNNYAMMDSRDFSFGGGRAQSMLTKDNDNTRDRTMTNTNATNSGIMGTFKSMFS